MRLINGAINLRN